jgi:dolichol-phosphate mannosyltransferase
MLALARTQGLDIVYGVRGDRSSDSPFKRSTAGFYYRLVRRLVGNDIPSQAGDFRLLSRATVEALRELPERRPVLRLVVPWLGFPSGEVTYVREERAAGRTKYSLSRMVRLAVDSVTSFSAAPLRVATWLGAGGMLLCGVLLVCAFVAYLLDSTVAGWASLYVAVLFLGAVQLLCLGLLGEYVGRMYTQLQGRPSYFVAYDSLEHPQPARPDPHQGEADDGQGRRQLTSSETPGSERTGR